MDKISQLPSKKNLEGMITPSLWRGFSHLSKGEEKRKMIFAPPSGGGDRRKLKSADRYNIGVFHHSPKIKIRK